MKMGWVFHLYLINVWSSFLRCYLQKKSLKCSQWSLRSYTTCKKIKKDFLHGCVHLQKSLMSKTNLTNLAVQRADKLCICSLNEMISFRDEPWHYTEHAFPPNAVKKKSRSLLLNYFHMNKSQWKIFSSSASFEMCGHLFSTKGKLEVSFEKHSNFNHLTLRWLMLSRDRVE